MTDSLIRTTIWLRQIDFQRIQKIATKHQTKSINQSFWKALELATKPMDDIRMSEPQTRLREVSASRDRNDVSDLFINDPS